MSRNYRYAICPGLLCALSISLGYSTKHYNGIRISLLSVLCCVGLTILFAVLITNLYSFFDLHQGKKAACFFNNIIPKSSTFYVVAFMFLLMMWFPVFLALYPGIFAYDADVQYYMYLNREVTTHHPVIHTYMLGWIVDTVRGMTGSINKGVAAYTITQEIVISAGCSYLLYLFHRRRTNTWIMIATLLLFCAYPPFLIMVFSCAKDIYFAVFFADFVMLTIELIENRERFFEKNSNSVMWITLLFLSISMRSNAIYAFVCVGPFWIAHIFSKKEHRSKMLCILCIAIIVTVIYRYPVVRSITIAGTSKAEMLSVPSQQIMRIYNYHNDELTKIEQEKISELFDPNKWYGLYVPEIADVAKGSLDIDKYNSNPKHFFETWLYFFKKYPREYVDSFMENTYGFWYPWPKYVMFSLGEEGYEQLSCIWPAVMNTKFAHLYKYLQQFENGDIVQKKALISWVFAPATFFLCAIISFFYCIKKREKGKMLPFALVGVLWCTYLLGPVALVRYALYLCVLMPVWFQCMFNEKNKQLV